MNVRTLPKYKRGQLTYAPNDASISSRGTAIPTAVYLEICTV